jgi:hypothetical protein
VADSFLLLLFHLRHLRHYLLYTWQQQQRFEADYLWRLQPVNLAEHQQRYHNDALPDRAVDSFLLLQW